MSRQVETNKNWACIAHVRGANGQTKMTWGIFGLEIKTRYPNVPSFSFESFTRKYVSLLINLYLSQKKKKDSIMNLKNFEKLMLLRFT